MDVLLLDCTMRAPGWQATDLIPAWLEYGRMDMAATSRLYWIGVTINPTERWLCIATSSPNLDTCSLRFPSLSLSRVREQSLAFWQGPGMYLARIWNVRLCRQIFPRFANYSSASSTHSCSERQYGRVRNRQYLTHHSPTRKDISLLAQRVSTEEKSLLGWTTENQRASAQLVVLLTGSDSHPTSEMLSSALDQTPSEAPGSQHDRCDSGVVFTGDNAPSGVRGRLSGKIQEIALLLLIMQGSNAQKRVSRWSRAWSRIFAEMAGAIS